MNLYHSLQKSGFFWNLFIFALLSSQGVATKCSSKESQSCFEKGKSCRTIIGKDAISTYECNCEFPLLEILGTCEYEPKAVHYGIQIKLDNKAEDLDSKMENNHFFAGLQSTARRLFPGATVYLQDINSNCKNKNTVKSVPSVWFKPKKCDFYASYRISAKQLSKHYIKQIFEDSLKNPKSSEYFFRDHSGISIEIGQLEAKPCSLCNHEQRCNPESKILCSCEALASNCIDYPILGAFRNFDEFEYYNFEDSLRAYRNEEKYSRDSNEMFSSCPSDQEDLCMTFNSTCVPAKDLISYTCECKYPYIGTNGTCQTADEVQGRVYQINLPLRSDSPWSKELANPLSHRYQRMKRNAERFLKAMFPGFSSSVLGFEAGTSKSRVIDSEVSLNFIITADKDFTEKDIISLLQKSQQNDGEVTIPGISFSALVDPSFISDILCSASHQRKEHQPPTLPNIYNYHP